MKTRYFTFGQDHAHRSMGVTFDKDVVLQIVAQDPRKKMFDLFGSVWSEEYIERPDLKYFPRGLVKLRSDGRVDTSELVK